MKQLIACLFLVYSFVSTQTSGQENLQIAPVNPDYVSYMSTRNDQGNFTEDGYPLGEMPSPTVKYFDPHYTANSGGAKFAASYDLRDINGGAWLSPVRDQGLEGACWAFATYGAVESYWLKNGLGQEDLSEQNIATCHGFDWSPADGGNYEISMAYLSRRSGPIDESDDPYTLPSNPGCVSGLTPIAYVDEARYLPGIEDPGYSPDNIKQAILDNGAIYINMRYDSDYMNFSDETYYYNGSEGTNHGVLLVGWDDDKVVTGGTATPSSSGAWIIRNSWGPSWGEAGYFYISYEDTKALKSVAYFPSTTSYNAESDVYAYDELGWCTSIGWSDGDDRALSKFTASADQEIQSIGTFITTANTNVDIYVYDNFDGSNLSTLLGSITSQNCAWPGYYSFDLTTPVNLSSGNDFYVEIRYYNSGNYPVPVETILSDYTSGATFETGKCWISSSGTSWVPVGTGSSYEEYDACIKVYATDVATTAPVADFSANPQTVVVGETVQFTDLSTGVPTSWAWTFEGADVTESTDQHPTASWSATGTYNITLTAQNTMGSNTITKEDYITVVNAPVSCESMTNIRADDNIVYYNASEGYVSGHNNYGFSKFAEFFENPALNQLQEVTIGVAKANALSSNPIISLKVWEDNSGIPGSELYSENLNIADLTAGTYNTIELASPVIVPETFYVGYQIYYETPQDTFAVYMAEDRGTASTYSPTALTYYSGNWANLDDIFTGGLNTAYLIELNLCPAPPVSNFTADVTEGCETLTVQFSDESLCNPDSWSWNFGDGETSDEQNPSHTYSVAGTYTVTLNTSNSIGSDSYSISNMINLYSNPTIDLGDDADICPGDSHELNAGSGMSYYNWFPSGNTQTIMADSEGIWAVTITDSHGCTASDQVEITALTAPGIDLGENIEACEAETPVTLDAGAGMSSYTWTPSGNTQTIEVSSSGTYSVVVEDANGCTASDDITVSILPAPNPEFGTAIIEVCEDEVPVTLDPNTGSEYSYLWSDGSGTETISVTEPGSYNVTVSYGSCTAEGDVYLHVQAYPTVYDLIGGGEIEDGSSAEILLSNSDLFVVYKLFHSANGEVASLDGNENQLSFGNFSVPGNYTATATTDSAQCSSDMNGEVEIIITNIDDPTSSLIEVFPNPATSFIKIVSEKPIDKISLFSADGKCLVSYDKGEKYLNIEKYSAGEYFIEITSGEYKTIRKIIKR